MLSNWSVPAHLEIEESRPNSWKGIRRNLKNYYSLIGPNQTGFKPGASCINQLPLITLKVRKSFDARCKVCSIFLGISKVFDEVWHKGLISELLPNGI